MRYFRVLDFEKRQHYKKRRPPWVKLHAERLDDYKFLCLSDASKAHALLLDLLASKLDNRIPFDAEFVTGKIGAKTTVDLESLIAQGVIEMLADGEQHDIALLASRTQDAPPEGEAKTESEADTPSPVDRFLEALPPKQNRPSWVAIIHGWESGLGLSLLKPATQGDIETALTDYLAEEGRDFNVAHVRRFVERVRDDRIKPKTNGTASHANGNGKRSGPKEYDYSKPSDNPGGHKWT